MGYASALGKLPQFFLRGQLDRVLQGLIQATEITEKESKWAEARRDAVTALARYDRHSNHLLILRNMFWRYGVCSWKIMPGFGFFLNISEKWYLFF